nr:MAG TPA: Protein of unknown function (DUF2681) [Caudoviricetes sp.]
MTLARIVAAIGANGVGFGALVAALSVLAGMWWGYQKAKAEALIAREQVAKARAEREQAETSATLDVIAGKIDERLDALEASVSAIHHEVTPNHGGSLKDAVSRIETNQEGFKATLDAHGQVLSAHGQVLDRITERQERDLQDLSDQIDQAWKDHESLREALSTIGG